MIIKIKNVGYDLEELLKTKTKVSNGMIAAFSKNNKLNINKDALKIKFIAPSNLKTFFIMKFKHKKVINDGIFTLIFANRCKDLNFDTYFYNKSKLIKYLSSEDNSVLERKIIEKKLYYHMLKRLEASHSLNSLKGIEIFPKLDDYAKALSLCVIYSKFNDGILYSLEKLLSNSNTNKSLSEDYHDALSVTYHDFKKDKFLMEYLFN